MKGTAHHTLFGLQKPKVVFQGRALASDYSWAGGFAGSLPWTGWCVGEQNLAPLNVSIWPMLFQDGYFLNWGRKWQPTPVFLPGKAHRPRILVGYSPWGRKQSDTTERLQYGKKGLWKPSRNCPLLKHVSSGKSDSLSEAGRG